VADYDQIADRWDETFGLVPYRSHIEAYSVFRLVGDVTGQAWLDVACGSGAYSRALRRRGAHPVVGVDLSAEMIRAARIAEDSDPLDIRYLVADVGALGELGPFDGALGVYLLHYSRSLEHLDQMCRSIAGNLRPGGRFVTFQLNPGLSQQPGFYRSVGVDLTIGQGRALADGDAFTFRIDVPGFTSPDLTVYYWGRPAIDDALRAAGFGEINWTTPALSPDASQYAAQWHGYLSQPLCVLIECRKTVQSPPAPPEPHAW
jgi:SAM-dependent methyltransferase